MYFTLTINEKLVDMLRTATELKAQVANFLEVECKTEEFSIHKDKITRMNASIGVVLNDIGDVIGFNVSSQAFKEAEKASKDVINNLNGEEP